MKKTDSARAQNDVYDGYNAFKIGFISDNMSHLLGEILTIVDACTEGDKNKAMKDLVRRAFSEKQLWFRELSWKYEEVVGSGHMLRQDWEKGLYPMDIGKICSFES